MHPTTDTLAKVLDLTRRHLRINGPGDEPVPAPDSRLVEDLGMDQLDIVELVMDVEAAFHILIHDNHLDTLTTATVADLARVADEAKAKGA